MVRKHLQQFGEAERPDCLSPVQRGNDETRIDETETSSSNEGLDTGGSSEKIIPGTMT